MFVLVSLFAVVILLCGLSAILWPRGPWYLEQGWRFKNAEPSDAALFVMRARGVFGMLVGVVLLVVAIKFLA